MDHRRRGERLGAVLPLALVMVSLPFVLGGCQTAACPARLHTDPLRALAQHQVQHASFRALKVEARVEQWGDRGRIRGTVLMLLERPDRVRFDVVTQLGPVSVLTSDGERFQLLDLREKRFIEGPTCADNIAALIGISLEAEDVLKLLTGDAPEIEAESESMECRGGAYVITRDAVNGSRQEIELSVPKAGRDAVPDEQRLRLRRSEVFDPSGKTRWRVTYSDYRATRGASAEQIFPYSIRFVDRSKGVDTYIRVKSIAEDPSIPPGAFQQTVPAGLVPEFRACP